MHRIKEKQPLVLFKFTWILIKKKCMQEMPHLAK